jgi:glycosyltransferase involved in cell wall biosynthesis
MKILVTHPGRQHSHQAALALEKAGLLAGYWSGVPASGLRRYAAVPIDPRKTRSFPWAPALRRLGVRADFAACRLFDRWAAQGLKRIAPDGVIACEISALSLFREARRRGIATILDAASIHHTAQDRLHGTTDPPGLHRRITRVKDEEIALADHVLTVSEMARETYVAAGVPPGKVHAVPLGADTELFSPEGDEATEPGFTFLFSGAAIRRKGFDLLLAAFEKVRAEVPDARLRIAGPPADVPEWVEVLGPLSQRELAAEFRRADALALPSRNDSYAMVVPEALASGLPVLVSEMVGAKDLVTEGETGWIVPVEDAAALADRMLWCARHRGEVRAMRPACRRVAEAATWPAYHARLADLLVRLVGASA